MKNLNKSVKVGLLILTAVVGAQGIADTELPLVTESILENQCRLGGREAKTVYIGNVRQARYWNLDQAIEAVKTLTEAGNCQIATFVSPECVLANSGSQVNLYLTDGNQYFAPPTSPTESEDGYVKTYATIEAALVDVEKISAAGLCNYPW